MPTVQIIKAIIGGIINNMLPFSVLFIAVTIMKEAHIIEFTVIEYLNDENNRDLLFERSEKALLPPIHNPIINERTNASIALPYTPLIIIVTIPSPVNHIGSIYITTTTNSPIGKPTSKEIIIP